MEILEGALLTAAARRIAALAHAGQVDGIGAPYQGHLDRVSARAEMLRARQARDLDPAQVAAVAVLHDTLEDTQVSSADLQRSGIGPDVVAAVEALTHRRGASRQEYLSGLLSHRLAVVVKLADTLDNADPVRLAKVADADRRARLAGKYGQALLVLSPAL